MRILAIDPGSEQSAWVLWDGEKILGMGKQTNAEVGNLIGQSAASDGTEPQSADVLAIEKIVGSYGGNAGLEVMDTAFWSGRFAQRWATHRGDALIIRIPRATVKAHLCGRAQANDSNVRAALIDKVGNPGTKSSPGATFGVTADRWAALGVAVAVFDRIKCGTV